MDFTAYFRYNLQQNDTQKRRKIFNRRENYADRFSCRDERKGHVSRICQRSIILWSEYLYGVHWRTTEYKKKKDWGIKNWRWNEINERTWNGNVCCSCTIYHQSCEHDETWDIWVSSGIFGSWSRTYQSYGKSYIGPASRFSCWSWCWQRNRSYHRRIKSGHVSGYAGSYRTGDNGRKRKRDRVWVWRTKKNLWWCKISREIKSLLRYLSCERQRLRSVWRRIWKCHWPVW